MITGVDIHEQLNCDVKLFKDQIDNIMVIQAPNGLIITAGDKVRPTVTVN